jgi:RNA polymerase sigma-70 factor, ECF subfamily
MALNVERNQERPAGETGDSSNGDGNLGGCSPRPSANGNGETRRSWRALVDGVKRGDREAMEALYASFTRGVRYYFCKHLGPADLDDHVHDAYLTVIQAIRTGSLREPEALMGFVKTIIRRQVAAGIDDAVQLRRERADFEVSAFITDDRQSPEQEAIGRQKTQLMVQVLEEISPRDREILTRFYLHGQNQNEICQEMQLTETQFRLLKSRAKARFGELGRKRLSPEETEIGLRGMAGA